jgi:hypothetical protein
MRFLIERFLLCRSLGHFQALATQAWRCDSNIVTEAGDVNPSVLPQWGRITHGLRRHGHLPTRLALWRRCLLRVLRGE